MWKAQYHTMKSVKKCSYIVSTLIVVFCVFLFSSKVKAATSVWDYLYGTALEGVDDNFDSDGDGYSNGEERLYGTDPLSADSNLNLKFVNTGGSVIIAKWKSRSDKSYQPQICAKLSEGWVDQGGLLNGNGDEFNCFVANSSDSMGFFRLEVTSSNSTTSTFIEVDPYDSDGDGVSDWEEFLEGSSPIEKNDKTSPVSLVTGSGVTISWNSQEGKYYQIKQKVSNIWVDYGLAHAGTGDPISVLVTSITGEVPELKLEVSDRDSDSDGINDWDEIQVGLDPDSPRSDATIRDADALIALIDNNNKISVEAISPFANVTTLEESGFKISRVTGSRELTVKFNITGSAFRGYDYETLPSEVTIPIGVREVTIPVIPLAGSSINSPRTVYITLKSGDYTVSGNHVRRVNIIKEHLVNVKDYGAVGDGVNDDTVAIQTAINALESNVILNTLYFPTGTYKLNSYQDSTETSYNTKRILKLGISDLVNRDILIRGEADAMLYSTASPQRAHMLIAMASYRSLTVSNLIFKQSDIPLSDGRGAQESDGVSIVRVDDREIERIQFEDTEFNNCHGSVFVYGNAFDVRGKLKHLNFLSCNVLNPYGSNTGGVTSVWGGGQQIAMGSWVGVARYEDCRFEGGQADMSDHSKAPGGRLKDGSHFGSPLSLKFINNSVKWMGVESMYQLNRGLYIGTSALGFTIPADDGRSVVTITVRQEEATFVPGQIINTRRPTTGTFAGKNNIFRVVAFRKALNEVDVVNDGYEGNDAPGTILPRLLPIYVQIDEPGIVEIRGNILEGKLPPGAEVTNPTGIVLDTTGVIENNYITGFATGILNYREASVPLFPGTTGLVVYKNYILMRHADLSPGSVTYGVQTHANDIYIVNNEIVCPLSRRSAGIALRGRGARVLDNDIIALVKQVNGYNDSQRSLGVLTGNTSFGTYVYRNTTQNFDIGVGSEPNQSLIHYVEDHNSIDDELAVDPRGVVTAPEDP